MRQITEVGQSGPEFGVGFGEALGKRGVKVRADPGAGQAKREGERDEPLLGAVVQIASQSAPFGVTGLDDPPPRPAQALSWARASA